MHIMCAAGFRRIDYQFIAIGFTVQFSIEFEHTAAAAQIINSHNGIHTSFMTEIDHTAAADM